MKSIVKDYLTGKEYVEIKRKPDLPIKGCASVYLYNARTGRLELEAHTPNIIYPEIYAWLRSYQWDKFCTGAYNKSISYSGYWEMDNIFLSSSSKPENERVRISTFNATNTSDGNPGMQIGWANKSTYSGSDTMRGTPNTAESYATNNRIHWVFDWPTHAANGTFQTIIWGNSFLPYTDTVLNKSIGIYEGGGNASFDLATDGTFLYTLAPDGIFYKISTSGDVLSSIDTGIRSYCSKCITFMDPYFYAMEYNGTLYKISTSGAVLNTYNTGINTNSSTGFGLASDGTYLYALSAYEKVLYKISADGTVISSHNIEGSMERGSSSGFSLTYVSPYLYVSSSVYRLYKISLTGEIIGALSSPIYTIYYTVGITSIGEYLYLLNYDRNLYKCHIADRYFARTRLAAPVTKTNQQTLKVQYDFIYEE